MLRVSSTRGVHVGRAEGQRLEPVERDVELLAGGEVLRGQLERRVHRAQRLVAVGDGRRGDHVLGRLGRVAALTQRGGRGLVEGDPGGTTAVEGRVRRPRAFCQVLRVDQEQLALGEDDQHVGAAPVEHRLLDAGQGVAVDRDPGLAAGRVGPGERRDELAGGQATEELLALLVAAAGGDQAAGEHDRLDERLGSDHPSELLGDDGHLGRSGAHAAVVLGERQAEHAHLGEPAPHRLVEARVLGDHLAAVLGVVPLEQSAYGVAQGGLLAIECEVHVVPSPRDRGSCRR